MSQLTVTKKFDGSTLIVTPAGRIDTTTSPELENEIKSSISGVKKIILDFAQTEYISSSGLRVLLSLHKLMTADGGELIISKPTEMVLEVFEVTGFGDILNIAE